MVKRTAVVISFLAAIVLLPAAQAHTKQNKLKAAQVFLDAANRTDLRAPGSPPFELLASIKLDIHGTWLNGTYLLLWDSPERWSEKIALPGYQRIRAQNPSGIWLHRNLDYEIPSVKDLDDALSFSAKLRSNVKLHPAKFKTREVLSADLECSRTNINSYLPPGNDFQQLVDLTIEDFCFDPKQAELRVELFPKGANDAPNLTSVEYSDFAPFGTKEYPRTIRLSSQGDTFLTFSVRRIALLVDPPSSDFKPPADGMFMATCAAPEEPKIIKQALPVYPRDERLAGRNGHVVLYVMIAADGSVKNARVIFSAGPEFDAAALAAVRRWRYQPRSCNGKPTPIEIYVPVYFQVG
ncbi:MAG: energy transducer TonB [Candidatus Acidiferrales bacterium]